MTEIKQHPVEKAKASEETKEGSIFDRLDGWAGEIDDPGRWPLLRDVLVFQGKLGLDALRDLALSPVSIGAAILGFVRDKDKPGKYFYPLMKTGKRSDTVINLFGAADHAGLDASAHDDPSIDELVKRFEKIIVKEYEAGGVTTHAKDAIDKAIDIAQEKVRKEAEKAAAQVREEAEKFKT